MFENRQRQIMVCCLSVCLSVTLHPRAHTNCALVFCRLLLRVLWRMLWRFEGAMNREEPPKHLRLTRYDVECASCGCVVVGGRAHVPATCTMRLFVGHASRCVYSQQAVLSRARAGDGCDSRARQRARTPECMLQLYCGVVISIVATSTVQAVACTAQF